MRIAIFRKRYEYANLAVGIAALVAAVSFTFSPVNLSDQSVHIGYYISGILFLNWTHTIFTLGIILRIGKQANSKPMIMKIAITYGFFLLLAVCCYSASLFQVYQISKYFNIMNLVMVLLAYGIYHTRKQVLGLSLLYNKRLRSRLDLTSAEESVWRRNERFERWGFDILCILLLCSFFLYFFTGNKYLEIKAIFDQWALFVSLLILLNACFLPHVFRSNKVIYLSRIVICALTPINVIASFIFMSLHGLEYFFITSKFFQKDKNVSESNSKLIAFVSFCCILHIVFWLLSRHAEGNLLAHFTIDKNFPLIAVIIGSVAATTHMIHFYADGLLFQFRNKACHPYTAPLLVIADEDC